MQYGFISLHFQTIGYLLLTICGCSSPFSGLDLYYSFTKLITKTIQVHIGMSANSAGAV